MTNKVIVITLTAIVSLGLISAPYADNAMVTKNQNCKNEAKTIGFKNIKDKTTFMKACKKHKDKEVVNN